MVQINVYQIGVSWNTEILYLYFIFRQYYAQICWCDANLIGEKNNLEMCKWPQYWEQPGDTFALL